SDDDVHVGPSDHVPWLDDRKGAYIRVEGRNFGDVPLNVELKLEVWDSPNSAGVVIDALRCCKVAQDRGIGGPLLGPSAYFMKSPPTQYRDEEAPELVDEVARVRRGGGGTVCRGVEGGAIRCARGPPGPSRGPTLWRWPATPTRRDGTASTSP